MQTTGNKGRTFKPEPLTRPEAEQLVGAIKGNLPLAVRNRALVTTLLCSGLRISEALALKPSDVNLEAGTVRVLHGKNDRDRTSVLDWRCIAPLRHWLTVRERLGATGRQPLFCSVGSGETRTVGQPINPSYMRRYLPRLARKAGIDKRVHPHAMRHTFANELLDRGVPLQHIKTALGHQYLATTELYLRKMNPADTIAAIRAAGMTVEPPEQAAA